MATDNETHQTGVSSTPSEQPTDSPALSVSDHELDLAEKQLARSLDRYKLAKRANDELRTLLHEPLRPEMNRQGTAMPANGRHAASEVPASEPSVRPVTQAPVSTPVLTSQPAQDGDTRQHIVPGMEEAPERSHRQRKNRPRGWFQSLRDNWRTVHPRGRIL
jgi:uncharacterized membrane protein